MGNYKLTIESVETGIHMFEVWLPAPPLRKDLTDEELIEELRRRLEAEQSCVCETEDE